MIFNTHTHLNSPMYTKADIDSIIDTCKTDNISLLVCGFDLPSSKKAVELSNEYDFIYAGIGIHPSDVSKFDSNTINDLRDLAINNKKVVAIGEIGFDFFYTKDNIDEQRKCFIDQLNLAKELKLPVIIHSRDAVNQTAEVLKTFDLNGVIHCYSYSKESLQMFLDLGYYISISGVVTFKNAVTLKEVVSELDINRLLVETDCPYLTPEPFRGQINKAQYVKFVINKVAEIKGLSVNDVEKITYSNALKLFNIK